jgi:hypothetical protein
MTVTITAAAALLGAAVLFGQGRRAEPADGTMATTTTTTVPPAASGGTVRIGAYDSRAVALAWSRSDTPSAKAWAKHRDELHRKAKALKEAGKQDGDEFKKMERELVNIQFLQHAIVFSTAPPESALKELEARLPDIAREAGVQIIVPRTDWQDPSLQVIDLTDQLVAEFKPTPEVKRMLGGFQKQRPITLEEVTRLRD